MKDYKEKYERALHNLKIIKDHNKDNKELVAFIEHEYPELKESEDERIRKELIRAFTVTANKRDYEIYGNGITYRQVLAWLEKQGEKKPIWSKDDDDNIMLIEGRLSDYIDYIWEDSTLTKHQKNSLKEEVIMYVNWFKSLKERMKGE